MWFWISGITTPAPTPSPAVCFCQNGGYCSVQNDPNSCVCPQGYIGQLCETREFYLYICSVKSFLTSLGYTIQYVNWIWLFMVTVYSTELFFIWFSGVQPCQCQNGGSCRDPRFPTQCTCAPQYYGTLCESREYEIVPYSVQCLQQQ